MMPQYTKTVFTVNCHYTDLAVPSFFGMRDYASMAFGSNLARLRLANKWTQEELAARLNVAQPTVQRWEAGGRQPRKGYLDAIARVFSVDVAALFEDGDGDRLPNADELEGMIQIAMRELPVGVTFEDYPRAVASSLHEQIARFQAAGGFQPPEAEETSHNTTVQPREPTKRSARAGSRIP